MLCVYVPHLTPAGIASRTEFHPPTAPLSIDKCTENYFWVQSFNWWINTVNTTIATAWAGLVAVVYAAAAGTIAAPFTEAPCLTWDNEFNVATLWVPTELFNQGYDWNPATTPCPAKASIFFNAPLDPPHTL